uniref:Uncharacterized protein n=1 Tax=Cacopsylla melanoneura TaxID=428564 RepID=A0A8D8UWC0_9HEMI
MKKYVRTIIFNLLISCVVNMNGIRVKFRKSSNLTKIGFPGPYYRTSFKVKPSLINLRHGFRLSIFSRIVRYFSKRLNEMKPLGPTCFDVSPPFCTLFLSPLNSF